MIRPLCASALFLAAMAAPQSPLAAQTAASRPDAATLARTVADAIRSDPALAGPIRGSVTLYDTGAQVPGLADTAGASDATIAWRSSKPAVLSATDRRLGADIVRKGVVRRGAADTRVRLTATVTVPGVTPVTVPLDVTIAARPAAEGERTGYLFVYFLRDTIDGEKIRFATSDGNNALQWKTLNDAKPVLESTRGTQGLRDPFILRSAEGDRFFLIATDLSAGRTGWGDATDRGSRYLEVWESTDLVNWGEQRHVRVSPPNAGMTWAPEATYDPTIDAYVVYWTSRLFDDYAARKDDGNGPQLVMATTRDFRTFTPPVPWFKAADVPELKKSAGMIDSTVLQDGGWFYRFTKATQVSGCPSADIIGQRSRSLRATTASGAWTMIDRCIGRNAGTPEVEGPSAFVANPGDVSGLKYYVWVDHYGGVGYIPLGTNSLEGKIRWTYPKAFSLPASPRHGSLVPITSRERDALAAKWNPTLLVTAVAPVVVEVAAGARPVLPATVDASFRDGHREPIGVTWDAPDMRKLSRAGQTVTVRGRLANSSATPAVATIRTGGAAR